MSGYIEDNLGLFHDIRAIFLKVVKRLGLYSASPDALERFTAFDEHPTCDGCGAEDSREVLIAIDGNRIVECESCGLWRTSPRIAEDKWFQWLRRGANERNKVVTENRLKYGVAMPQNIAFSRSGWGRRLEKRHKEVFSLLERFASHRLLRIHDVGCGVGFFLAFCRAKGLRVSGNELNEYAVRAMRERFGLEVYPCVLGEVPVERGSVDAITMNAYIEHSYHPYSDLLAASSLLKQGGLLYLSTFHTDSVEFDRLGKRWDMFTWNHVYHFSSRTLGELVKKAGFEILEDGMKYDAPVSHIVCRNE